MKTSISTVALIIAGILLLSALTLMACVNNRMRESSTRQGSAVNQATTEQPSPSSTQDSQPDVMYAKEEAPLYTGPGYNSSRFKRSGAQIPRTISKYDDVKVLEKMNGWYKVETLGDVAWVPEKYLVPQWTADMRSDRFKIMVGNLNDLLGDDPNFKPFYERVHIASASQTLEITLYVNDNWRRTAADTKLDFIKQTLVFLAGSRALQGMKNETKNLKVIHQPSGRVVATWDDFSGPKLY